MAYSVLVVSSKYPPEYAGSGFRAHRTYQRLKANYPVEVSVLANSWLYRNSHRYEVDAIPVRRISSRLPSFSDGSLANKAAVLLSAPSEWLATEYWLAKNRNQFNLIHTFGNSWSVAAATWFAARRGIPLIRELCNDMSDPYYPKQVNWLMRSALDRKAAIMVAISPRLERVARDNAFDRVWLKPNPIEEKFRPREGVRLELRREITRFSGEDTLIVYVANYTPGKNHRFLLDVLKDLPSRYKLLLGGPLRPEMEPIVKGIQNEIASRGLTDRVQLETGFVSNIEEWLLAGDVFAFPTRTEGLGTPVLEAQACACPVVMSAIPGISDAFVKEGVGGFTAPLVPEIWADLIEVASEIPRDVLVENAHDLKRRFSSEVVDRGYVSILRQLDRSGQVREWPSIMTD